MSRLSALAFREMRQTAIYVAGLTGAAFLTAGIVLMQVPAQFHLPLSVAIERSLPIPFGFGMVGVMQLVQLTVLKEKVGGGFLFLRMLPVNDAEIISSKLLAILLDVLLICGIPLLVFSSGVIYFHVGFPEGFWLEVAWSYVSFAALAVGMAACAIRFDSQRALLFPLFVFIALFGAGYLAWKHLPTFIALVLRARVEKWGILVVLVLIWLGWRGTIYIFSKQDFVQLSE
jgi:hypothetical protein